MFSGFILIRMGRLSWMTCHSNQDVDDVEVAKAATRSCDQRAMACCILLHLVLLYESCSDGCRTHQDCQPLAWVIMPRIHQNCKSLHSTGGWRHAFINIKILDCLAAWDLCLTIFLNAIWDALQTSSRLIWLHERRIAPGLLSYSAFCSGLGCSFSFIDWSRWLRLDQRLAQACCSTYCRAGCVCRTGASWIRRPWQKQNLFHNILTYFDNFEGVKGRELEPKFVGERRSSGPTALGIWIEHGTLDCDWSTMM